MIKPIHILTVVSLSVLTVNAEARASSWLEEIDARIFTPSPQQKNYNDGVALFKAGKPDEAFGKFQMAASGDDRDLKAKALHNTAVIHIDRKELEPARELLKQALSYDNGSQEIKENLAWVEEQLKDAKKDPSQNPDQDQKQDQDQKSAEEKPAEPKTAEEQNAHEKAGEKSDASEDEKPGQKGSEEQKTAEQDQGQAGQGEQAENKDEQQGQAGEEKDQAAEQEALAEQKDQQDGGKANDKDKRRSVTLDPKQAPEAGQAQKDAMLLTPAEIKQQEAERLLRNIDDKIGRYPLTDTEATGRRGKDGKNW